MSPEERGSPQNEDSPAEFSRWLARGIDRGKPGVVVAAVVMFVIVLATLGIQLGLIVVLWLYVYPTAAGATERTVVLVAIFAGLAVFLAELSTIFQGTLVYQFLTRPRPRRRVKTIDDSIGTNER
jgi:hypothetical protein